MLLKYSNQDRVNRRLSVDFLDLQVLSAFRCLRWNFFKITNLRCRLGNAKKRIRYFLFQMIAGSLNDDCFKFQKFHKRHALFQLSVRFPRNSLIYRHHL